MNIKTLCGGYDQNFTYIVHDDTQCCIIDPALPAGEVLAAAPFRIIFVVFLHSHFDHIVDLEVYRQTGIPIYGHTSTKVSVDRYLKDGEEFGFGGIQFKVLHTPGHRYDSMCLLAGKHLFTSDTLFVEGCGRVDVPGSDVQEMLKTLRRLRNLPGETIIHPGHDYGSTPITTIAREKKQNPCLKEGFLNGENSLSHDEP